MLLSSLPDDEIDALYRDREALPSVTPHTITSLSRLRAELAEIAARGLAYDDAESSEDVHCVATGVRDHSGAMVAEIGDAANRNFRRWTETPPQDDSYAAEIALMKDFLRRRSAWIKIQLDTGF